MLSDQTSSCPHQVHGVLVFECTVQSLCLFVVRNNSCPFFLYGNKMVEWLWTFHFFVWFVYFDSVQWHKLCLCLNILKHNRCFSYFSWFVFCCKCCKTVDQTVYNLLRQPFLGRLSVEPDFVKALLYWPFWYMPVAVTIWIIKPVVDKCFFDLNTVKTVWFFSRNNVWYINVSFKLHCYLCEATFPSPLTDPSYLRAGNSH